MPGRPHAKRFRALLADLGLKHPDAALMLHVSLRTLQNWLSGRHELPYVVVKLLRLLRYMELPGQAGLAGTSAGATAPPPLKTYHLPVDCCLRTAAAMSSTASVRLARWANAVAVKPCWFLSKGSAPASSSSLTAGAVP